MKLILASQSPRRQELMKLITEDFTVCVSHAPEFLPPVIDPTRAAEFLACQKACAVAQDTGADITVGCDTVVVIDRQILGKPKDANDAKRMLKLLSGKTHTVYTGVCLVTPGEPLSFTEETQVTFCELSDEEIDGYILSGEPMDKAGAYGIQGLGARFVKEIHGDYFNVVGLPVCRLYHELQAVLKGLEKKA